MKWSIPVCKGYETLGAMQVPEQQSISSSSSGGSSSSSSRGISAQLQDILRQQTEKETQLQAFSCELRKLEEAAAQMADSVSDTELLAKAHSTHIPEPAEVQLHETGINCNHKTYAGYPAVSVRVLPAAAAADACSAAGDCQAKGHIKNSSSAAAAGRRWRCIASRRAELLLRWQCLLEERKQLTLLLQAEQGHCRLTDFEPGQSPVRDVTCAVVTHQFDLPCFSCCFQR
ncbi:hypothetical protein OEZ86_006386 [Tetradesmus obliquus]|nr:hypothetical protein OEZ86_006386 [Tetradesmus obliquus]